MAGGTGRRIRLAAGTGRKEKRAATLDRRPSILGIGFCGGNIPVENGALRQTHGARGDNKSQQKNICTDHVNQSCVLADEDQERDRLRVAGSSKREHARQRAVL